jgi:hypothetical protein
VWEDETLDVAESWKRWLDLLDLAGLEYRSSIPSFKPLRPSDQGCIASPEGGGRGDGWDVIVIAGTQNLNHYHVWLARCEIVESLPASSPSGGPLTSSGVARRRPLLPLSVGIGGLCSVRPSTSPARTDCG